MQYSFESWVDPVAPARQAQEADAFPFSEDLKELEDSLSMNLAEGMNALEAETIKRVVENLDALSHTVPDEARWDELARLVADHVMTYLQEIQHPLQTELERARRTADEYYRDNRAMASQIQDLMEENQRLQALLKAYEANQARYRSVLGNLYLRL